MYENFSLLTTLLSNPKTDESQIPKDLVVDDSTVNLPEDLEKKIGTTLPSIFLGVFQVLLFRFSNVKQIIIGRFTAQVEIDFTEDLTFH